MSAVIDIHSHLAFSQIFPSAFLSEMLEGSGTSASRSLPMDKVQRLIRALLNDAKGSRQLKQMDQAGIQKSVLLIIDGGIGIAEPVLNLEAIFALHAEILKQYPERFMVFASGDPRRGEAGLRLFEKSIDEYHFHGLKLYPPMGFPIDDPSLEPWYAICNARRLPVLIHTGPSLKSLNTAMADPNLILRVAHKYPQATFILAHAAYRIFRPDIQELLTIPNVYADIAGFHSVFPRVSDEMKSAMGEIFAPGLQDKVLFGTDWPLFNLLSPIQKITQLIREFYRALHPEGDGKALDKIMSQNAAQVLGL